MREICTPEKTDEWSLHTDSSLPAVRNVQRQMQLIRTLWEEERVGIKVAWEQGLQIIHGPRGLEAVPHPCCPTGGTEMSEGVLM